MGRFDRTVKILAIVAIILLGANLAVATFVDDAAMQLSGGDDASKPLVVSSTTVLDDLVFQIAHDTVDRNLLVGPGGDPHDYEPTTGDQVAVEEADLVVLNGFGHEPMIERMVESVDKSEDRVLVPTTGLDPVYVAEGAWVEEVREEAEDPDDVPDQIPDPHLWMTIPNAMVYVDNIRDQLIELFPENEALYRANAAEYKAKLELVDRTVRETLDTIPEEHRKLVTTHDAFRYFGGEYGIEVIDTVWGVTTDREVTAQEVAQLADNIRENNVTAVFPEDSVRENLLVQAANEADALVGGTLFSDSLGLPGSQAHSFVSMMLYNAKTLAEGLGGDPEVAPDLS